MKFIIFLTTVLLVNPSFANNSFNTRQFQDKEKLTKMWDNGEIFLSLLDTSYPTNFDGGELYHYSTGNCISLHYKKNGKNNLTVSTISCPEKLKNLAIEPYNKIYNFKKYKKIFIECLSNMNKKCLRPLMSKNLKISFGPLPLMDRRDILFESWSSNNFLEMLSLVKQGTVGNDYQQDFPPKPSAGGTGQRGGFTKKNGYWLMTHYLAGD